MTEHAADLLADAAGKRIREGKECMKQTPTTQDIFESSGGHGPFQALVLFIPHDKIWRAGAMQRARSRADLWYDLRSNAPNSFFCVV